MIDNVGKNMFMKMMDQNIALFINTAKMRQYLNDDGSTYYNLTFLESYILLNHKVTVCNYISNFLVKYCNIKSE